MLISQAKKMASKTREKLIDVARQLFAHKGMENTTMNDIASASEKGRRTIYTYFKSKSEIFNAVINHESNIIVDRLAELPTMPLPPEEKLMNFIFIRFESVKEVVVRNGSLRAGFFRDVRRVDRVRRRNSSKEAMILKQILNEGVERGVFNIKHVDQMAMVMLLCLQGLDIHYIRDSFADLGIDKLKLRKYINDFILSGIKNDENKNSQQ
jgi:AcrR family transcriptional regulator